MNYIFEFIFKTSLYLKLIIIKSYGNFQEKIIRNITRKCC